MSMIRLYNNTKNIKSISLGNILACIKYPESYTLDFKDLDLYPGGELFPIPVKTAADKIISQHVATTPTEGVLYFDKLSKFPRVKLTGTKFKRVIKISSCDHFVMDLGTLEDFSKRDPSWSKYTYNFWESDTEIYDIPTLDDSYLDESDRKLIRKFLKINKEEEIVDGLIRLGLIPKEVTSLGKQNYYLIHDNSEATFVENYLSKVYDGKTFISDNELDSIINSTLEDLTYEDFVTFNDMLSSEDSGVVGMGLKLLSNYNISKFPYAVTTLLNLNYLRISGQSIWTSVGLKQLQNSISYKAPTYGDFPANILGLRTKSSGYGTDDVDIAFKLAEIHWTKFESDIEASFNKMLADKGLV